MDNTLKKNIERISGYLEDGNPLLAFHVEATGFMPDKDKIVAFAATKCERIQNMFRVLDKCDMLINPGMHIKMQEKATKRHGITQDMMKNGTPEQEAFNRIYKIMGERPILVGSHLDKFSIPLLTNLYKLHEKELRIRAAIDIGDMIQECMPGLESYEIANITNFYNLGQGIDLTTSGGKTIALVRILNTLYHKVETEVEEEIAEEEIAKEIEEPVQVKIQVVGTKYWKKDKQERIYLVTNPDIQAYYDCFKHKWVCMDENADKDQLIRDAMNLKDASTINEFIKASKS